MDHSQWEFLQREQEFTRLLEDADNNFFTYNVHIYIFYLVTSVTVILMTILLMVFLEHHVRLNILVRGLTVSKILHVETVVY